MPRSGIAGSCWSLFPARLFSLLCSHQQCFAFCSQTPEELEDVSDLEEDLEVRSHTSLQTEGKTDRAKMTQLPEAEKEKIAEQVADFKKVKSKLDAEIEIWDDTSNDIIVLAKKMCVIMMEMTDFTR